MVPESEIICSGQPQHRPNERGTMEGRTTHQNVSPHEERPQIVVRAETQARAGGHARPRLPLDVVALATVQGAVAVPSGVQLGSRRRPRSVGRNVEMHVVHWIATHYSAPFCAPRRRRRRGSRVDFVEFVGFRGSRAQTEVGKTSCRRALRIRR